MSAFNRGFWVCSRRGSVGGNAGEGEEEGDTNKKARKEKAGTQRIAGWGLREFSKIGETSRLAERPFCGFCSRQKACRCSRGIEPFGESVGSKVST
jgi:hypothetical protein